MTLVKLFWNSATRIHVEMMPYVTWWTMSIGVIVFLISMGNGASTNTTIVCYRPYQSMLFLSHFFGVAARDFSFSNAEAFAPSFAKSQIALNYS